MLVQRAALIFGVVFVAVGLLGLGGSVSRIRVGGRWGGMGVGVPEVSYPGVRMAGC